MSAHTPGPWGLQRSETGPWAIFNTRGAWIATTLRKAWPSEDLANARLMAAAPSMLDALREVETYLEEREDVVDGAYGQPKANTEMTLLREVRAAIAKAQP